MTSNGAITVVGAGTRYQIFTADGTSLGTLGNGEPDDPIDVLCGVTATTGASDPPMLFTVRRVQTAQAGVEAPKTNYYVTAWSTADLSRTWETQIASLEESDNHSDPCYPEALSVTTDGKWIVTNGFYSQTSMNVVPEAQVLDTENGTKRTVPFELRPIGSRLTSVSVMRCIGTCPPGAVFDPATLAPIRSVSDGDDDPDSALRDSVRHPTNSTWFDEGNRVAVALGGSVRVLNIATGQLDWSAPVGQETERRSGQIIVDEADGLLAVDEVGATIGGPEFRVHVYSLQTGQELWSQESRGLCAMSGGQVNVIVKNQMVLLDAKNGSQVDYTSTPNTCDHPNGLYTFNNDGAVYKLVDS